MKIFVEPVQPARGTYQQHISGIYHKQLTNFANKEFNQLEHFTQFVGPNIWISKNQAVSMFSVHITIFEHPYKPRTKIR